MQAPVRCYHCQDVVPPARLDDKREKQFCCHGCALAAALINDKGAGAYYALRDQQTATQNTEVLLLKAEDYDAGDFDAYASPAFQEHYVNRINDDVHQVSWYVQGAHCAACVWLLERLHLFDPAVSSSRMHIGQQQLITRYDPQHTDPSRIARQLAALGYRVYPWHSPQRQQQQVADQRSLFLRFAVACASMLGVMHVSWNILAGEFTLDLDESSRSFFALLAALLSIPALTWCAWPWYRSAWRALQHRYINIDVSISSIIALGTAVSIYHLLLGRSDLYFDAMTMFICFLLGGNTVLYMARQHISRQQNTLTQLLPLFVTTIKAGNEIPTRIDDIAIGDMLILQAGQRLPVDARLLEAHVSCDHALLSGESLPRLHHSDDIIPAGALILDQTCRLQATSTCAQSRIARLLESAKPQEQSVDLSARLLQWFTPLVSLLALATWLLWSQLDPSRAWDQAVAVFIVACPCALGIAAPLAHAVLMRRAAAIGILVTQPQKLDALQKASHIVFDKTGTLTHGQLKVADVTWLGDSDLISPHLVQACKQSQHPIARCLCQHFADYPAVDHSAAITLLEQGLSYACPMGTLQVCKARQQHGDGCNQTEIYLNDELVAYCSFEDRLREELIPFIQALNHLENISCSISSGDHQDSVNVLAARIGIPAQGDQSPESKAAYIQSLRSEQNTVVMIGDGVNDALALQAADLGIGVRGGLEAAMQHSDVYITDHIEERLPQLWQLARGHRRCLHSCLGISLLYNIIGIGLAMAGYWGPFICAIAMPLSSISVMALAWYWPLLRQPGILRPAVSPQSSTPLIPDRLGTP